jgi:hypothetical protein
MALVSLTSELEAANSLFDLARRLGERCLEKEDYLKDLKGEDQSGAEIEDIAARVKRISRRSWETAIADPTAFGRIAGRNLLDALEKALMTQPLDFLGVLRGLCVGALFEVFQTFTGELPLDRGMPIPFATRTPPEEVEWMTRPKTRGEGGLFEGLDWTLFRPRRDEGPRVVLDYSHRERIDELLWTKRKRLPVIATVHPSVGELDYTITRPGKFFDVRPKQPDPKWLLTRLARAKKAQIGVLPEVCLARPDELEAPIAADPGAYPALIVAGSAHVRVKEGGREVRANESRIYLDGVKVASHRKVHRFKTKKLDKVTFPEPVQEDLSTEPKTIRILAATHTRLAVVICADLLDENVPDHLVAAGVNTLLAPAMTGKPGSFETTVEAISGRWQGVSAVANPRLHPSGKPFLCMLGNPRANRSERFACLDGSEARTPPDIAVYDSWKALPGAVRWR